MVTSEPQLWFQIYLTAFWTVIILYCLVSAVSVFQGKQLAKRSIFKIFWLLPNAGQPLWGLKAAILDCELIYQACIWNFVILSITKYSRTITAAIVLRLITTSIISLGTRHPSNYSTITHWDLRLDWFFKHYNIYTCKYLLTITSNQHRNHSTMLSIIRSPTS